ncbi:hypothetical protein [Paraburkholderia sediminicola]|uniref:hypothetical protein n=1 Tax=Paraburkholderia sediminicola TaxID=458836 RepID=UPI0038B735B3
MSYSAHINSQSPGCFLLLLDMSPYMRALALDRPSRRMRIGDSAASVRTPYEECVSATNDFLESVVSRCMDGERIKPYYELSVLGYTLSPDGTPALASLLPQIGPSIFHDVSDLERGKRWRDAKGELVTDDLTTAVFATWIDPAPAITHTSPIATELLIGSVRNWRQLHPTSFPPVIFHMTGGFQFPAQLEVMLRALLESYAVESEPLLFNCVVPRHKALGNLILPTLDVPPFDDLTLLSIWQSSSTLPKPIAQRLQGDEEVPQRFRCFCLAASRDATSQFLIHVFGILPSPGTLQGGKHSDLDAIRRTQRETEYKRVAETRARNQEKRAQWAYVISILSLTVSLLALLFTILKSLMAIGSS